MKQSISRDVNHGRDADDDDQAPGLIFSLLKATFSIKLPPLFTGWSYTFNNLCLFAKKLALGQVYPLLDMLLGKNK